MTNADIDEPTIALAGKQNAKMKVWGYLKNNMTSFNRIVCKQTMMAAELDVTRQYIGKALKHLEGLDYIVRDGKEQTNIVYMVNPELVWKGNHKDMEKGVFKFKELLSGSGIREN